MVRSRDNFTRRDCHNLAHAEGRAMTLDTLGACLIGLSVWTALLVWIGAA